MLVKVLENIVVPVVHRVYF